MLDDGRMIVNYGAFEKHALDIEKKNKDMRETLDKIQARINSLKGDYESNAAETIRENITNMSSSFELYQQVVDSYVKFIRNAAIQAKNLEGTITNNASLFKK